MAALWFRCPAAQGYIASSAHKFSTGASAGGGLRCSCGRAFARGDARAFASCWLAHGLERLDKAVVESLPCTSLRGLGGRWLEQGESCPVCRSSEPGWVCGGGDVHSSCCEQAWLHENLWQKLSCGPGGQLSMDRSRHCVHVPAPAAVSHMDAGLRAIRRHLRAHACADKKYLQSTSDQVRRLRKRVQCPALPTFMRANLDDVPTDVAPRVRAFDRIAAKVSPGLLLQQVTADSADFRQRLPELQPQDLCLRRGSVIADSLSSDARCVLKVDVANRQVYLGYVQQVTDCSRHPRCGSCYHFYPNQAEWMPMDKVTGKVFILSPRFGWTHDLKLPLHKVCWRRAEVLGSTEDYWTHQRRQLGSHEPRRPCRRHRFTVWENTPIAALGHCPLALRDAYRAQALSFEAGLVHRLCRSLLVGTEPLLQRLRDSLATAQAPVHEEYGPGRN